MREHENKSRHDAPETLNLIELKKKDINSLIKIAREYNIENANSMRVQDLIFALLQAQTKQNGVIWFGCFRNTTRWIWFPKSPRL